MSNKRVDGPYLYQPFGSLSHKNHAKVGRLWGIGGLPEFAVIEGLTRPEAEAILATLKTLPGKETLDDKAKTSSN